MQTPTSDPAVHVHARNGAVSAVSEAREPAWAVSLFLAALGLWTGAAVFFSAGVLPVLFTNLEVTEAGRIAALIFPLYFRAGFGLGVVACIAAAVLARGSGPRWKAILAILAVMTLAEGWTAMVVHPEMARIRGVASEVARFQHLHEVSIRLNAVVLLGGVSLLAASGLLFSIRRAGTRRRAAA